MQKFIEEQTDRMRAARVFCDGLLDQGRKIGNDPVGHKCSNRAVETVWLNGASWRLCEGCARLWHEDSPRLTVPVEAGRIAGE